MNDQDKEITTAFKKHYPFRLACPSFIYPAGYADNVNRLGECVDEIELLFFESGPGDLPAAAEINELKSLGRDREITYNIHLPTDVSLGVDHAAEGDAAVEALLRTIDLSRPLAPVSYTLHIPLEAAAMNDAGLAGWRNRVRDRLRRLLARCGLPSRHIAIETLDYPLEYLDTVIREFDLSICLDTGHLMVRGEDCRKAFATDPERVIIIHTHGVENSRDHLALHRLSPEHTRQLQSIIQNFKHSLSLEVFSRDALVASLDYLDRIWRNPAESDHA